VARFLEKSVKTKQKVTMHLYAIAGNTHSIRYHKSVSPSVCLTVTLVDCFKTAYVSSKCFTTLDYNVVMTFSFNNNNNNI